MGRLKIKLLLLFVFTLLVSGFFESKIGLFFLINTGGLFDHCLG